MLRLSPKVLAAAVVAVFGARASAATQLIALPDNAHENPPTHPTLQDGVTPRPASFGTASFSLNDAQTAMTMTVTVQNIDFTGSQTFDTNDNLLNAHIHAAANSSATTNSPVVWGFFGAPFNDNNPPDVVVTPFGVGGVGGTITAKWDAPEGQGTTLTAQLANILSEHAYINFHTTQFTGGEIRAFLTVVPEPATAALIGLVPLAILRRRRWP